MKKLIYISFFLLSASGFSQWEINVLNITTNDLIYDSNTARIYASIPSANGSNGNSIGIIDPATITLENTVYMGSEPTVLAISDNGQYIYSAFEGASIVRRFDVAGQTADIQFSLGTDQWNGAFYAEDIEVMPGHPETIAVSRRNYGVSPRHEGVAIYDNGVMRETTTPDHTGSNKIEFVDQHGLLGYNNETTEFGIRRLSVNSGGVTNTSVYPYILQGFGLNFIYNNNRMYATNGTVLDTSNIPFVIGNFANANGPVAFDANTNMVCYISYEWNQGITFKRFNSETFLLTDQLPITQSFSEAKSLITCGNGCYAFNTLDHKVIILKNTSMAIDEQISSEVALYPNPATDWLAVKGKNKIQKILIFNMAGKLMYKNESLNNERIDISSLTKGIYIIKIQDINGTIHSNKLIKK